MRVVFLTHNFPRYPGDLSGAFLVPLARGLQAAGVEVQVVAPSDRGTVGESLMDGIPVRRVRYASPAAETLAYRGTMAAAVRTPSGALRALALGRALRRATREELAAGADLVHAHWWIPGGLAAPPEAPLVLTVHGTDGVLLDRGGLIAAVARPLFRRARVVLAVSSRSAEIIERRTGRAVPVEHRQPMPLIVDGYPVANTGGAGAIVIARLTRQKRVDLAIQAMAQLPAEGPRLELTVVGDGPERPALEALSASLGMVGRVHFLGGRPPSEIPRLLQNRDLMLFPAQGEGFGLSAAESLVAGVPVIACRDGGGVLDIVPPSGAGRVVDPTPAALSAAMLELLRDPAAHSDARRLGQEWGQRLDPRAIAELHLQWYRGALDA